RPGQVLRLPVAHGDGAYFADGPTLERLEGEGRVVARYGGTSHDISLNSFGTSVCSDVNSYADQATNANTPQPGANAVDAAEAFFNPNGSVNRIAGVTNE